MKIEPSQFRKYARRLCFVLAVMSKYIESDVEAAVYLVGMLMIGSLDL